MDNMGAMVLNIGDNRAYKTALDGYSYYWFEGLITETNPDVSLAMYTGMTVDSVAGGNLYCLCGRQYVQIVSLPIPQHPHL